MARKKGNGGNKVTLGLKCFSRVTIVDPDGTIVGDSGFTGPNMITNNGLRYFLAGAALNYANSSAVNYMALGIGTTAASDATALPSECMASTKRHSITSRTYSQRAASNDYGTAYLYGTFASNWNTVDYNISNVGLFASSNTNDSLFAANTYASSGCATNQAVNVTYQIQICMNTT